MFTTCSSSSRNCAVTLRVYLDSNQPLLKDKTRMRDQRVLIDDVNSCAKCLVVVYTFGV
jgi:hypothetical protein